jgi:hypothetical protein
MRWLHAWNPSVSDALVPESYPAVLEEPLGRHVSGTRCLGIFLLAL